ncbi:MAG: YraN family protein [Tannerellaceae bacterium]|jgi:lipopolysaccharide export system permease protein|nr:YraN family protein [Tannerellaceae bacterium]
MKRLYSYVLQSFLPIFGMTFGICLFIVLMQFIWRYIDDMVGKGLDFPVLAELFFYAALFLLPMALPLAILLASLMTFGNLGERLELLAIKSAGVSLIRIMRPLALLVASISVGAFFFQNNVLPVVQVKLWGLLFSVRQKSPELDIPQGVFYSEITGFNLYVKQKDKDGRLIDMMIYDYSAGFNNARVIVADSGRLSMSFDKKFLILTLHKGESFENLRQEKVRSNRLHPASVAYRRESFGSKEILIDFDANFTRIDDSFLQNEYMGKNLHQLRADIDSMTLSLDSLGQANARLLCSSSYHRLFVKDSFPASSGEMLHFDSLLASGEAYHDVLVRARNIARDSKEQHALRSMSFIDQLSRIRRYSTEWHKKFTVSAACLLFFFVGAPLGAIIRKGGLGVPVILSIFLFIFYYILDNVGLKMARNGIWPVWQGMWLSAAALALFASFLTWKAVKDSVILDVETYLDAFKRLGDRRTGRKISPKEVIIYRNIKMNEMKSKTAIGREGERIAQEFLVGKGYRILDTNWRWHHFELDIVALDGETLVIVEVKTRSSSYLVSPQEAVDGKKIFRLSMAADSYARRLKKIYPVRFDIITVLTEGSPSTEGKRAVDITHMENAYFPPAR